MDLRQLAALTAVAEAGSFSAAARRLHTVQSNVSTHVARLEAELGATLVDRSTGTLTDEGDVVVSRARRIQHELESLRADVDSMLHEVSGAVRLGCIGTVGRWLVPRLLQRMGRSTPASTSSSSTPPRPRWSPSSSPRASTWPSSTCPSAAPSSPPSPSSTRTASSSPRSTTRSRPRRRSSWPSSPTTRCCWSRRAPPSATSWTTRCAASASPSTSRPRSTGSASSPRWPSTASARPWCRPPPHRRGWAPPAAASR